ncbi:hypothetical protein COT47_04860 [Candidatus Woesearchaeota archaeon CG08_land_8_20_14_0_20_43_7]|nr:MAG: hypothetical protein COT47_04860 [Candidatus Woesearchaeota archaeon CG08_land_8_20_14_0_20_43_7]
MEIKTAIVMLKKHGYDRFRKLMKERKVPGSDAAGLSDSYKVHMESVKEVKHVLDEFGIQYTCVRKGCFEGCKKNKPDVIITIGGDGTFISASHHIMDNTPIIGVNSDTKRSVGKLCHATAETFKEKLSALISGKGRIMEFTRMDVTICSTKKKLCPIMNELLVTTKDNIKAARYDIEADGRKATHIDSGLLVSTGAGSTGWIYNASRLLKEDVGRIAKELGHGLDKDRLVELTQKMNDMHICAPTERRLMFRSQALMDNSISEVSLASGSAGKIKITSRMLDGMLVIDANRKITFAYGETLILEVSKRSLNVVV